MLLPILFSALTLSALAENVYHRISHPKCCDSESVFQKFNGSAFTCIKDENQRLQIQTNDSRRSKNGTKCVEIVDNKIYLFKLNENDDNIEIESELTDIVALFPKCCPLNYAYNSQTHGCSKIDTNSVPFFGEMFLKIGLPNCKVIVDSMDPIHLSDFAANVSGNQCMDRSEKGAFIFRKCMSDYKVCEKMKCVHKCCPDGQSFINGSFCRNTYTHGIDLNEFGVEHIENPDDDFAIIHGFASPTLYPLSSGDIFMLNKQGTFSLKITMDNLSEIKEYTLDEDKYCIEHAVKNTRGYRFFCSPLPEPFQVKFFLTSIAMSISCVFLLATISYYLLSNEKHTTFGKILISYCFATLAAFLLFSYLAYDARPEFGGCVILAFLVYYAVLASFTWMNIMSIDIYWTFGSFKAYSHHRKEFKRFILYSVYGWGAPLALTAITLTFYNVRVLPSMIDVVVDKKKCTISNENYGKFIFLTTYLAILEMVNVKLFIKTVFCCLKVKKEITKINDTNTLKGEKKKFSNFQDRFGLIMKLFLIMGVSFVFEVVSAFYSFRNNQTTMLIETVWDTIISLQGVFIFLIFILKKRIFLNCKNRLVPRLRKVSLMSSVMTQTTSVPLTGQKE